MGAGGADGSSPTTWLFAPGPASPAGYPVRAITPTTIPMATLITPAREIKRVEFLVSAAPESIRDYSNRASHFLLIKGTRVSQICHLFFLLNTLSNRS